MPAGKRARREERWLREVDEVPVRVRRSVDVKMRIRERPVEGKSGDYKSENG